MSEKEKVGKRKRKKGNREEKRKEEYEQGERKN